MILNISNIVSEDDVTSNISSDPRQICICTDTDLICNHTYEQEVQTVRGKKFTVRVITVGLNNGVVPSEVLVSPSNDFVIGTNQSEQQTGKTCTPITYQIVSVKILLL